MHNVAQLTNIKLKRPDMTNLDFSYDHDDFKRDIAKTAHGYKRALSSLLDYAKYWIELGSEYLGGAVSIEIDGETITGAVLGQAFAVHLAPLIVGKENFALAILSVPNPLSTDRLEVGRFLIDVRGSVLAEDREELLNWEDDAGSYRLLVAIARLVLTSRR